MSIEPTVEPITALGLFAEWTSAAAFALRHPDLRLIARSAERWRRTCAGNWAYTPAPYQPSWSRRPDATIADRITQLDSEEACLEQIRTGSDAAGRDDARDLVRRLRGRYPAADRKSRGATADDAAVILLDHHVPSAFVPPLAVLASTEGK
jgi:hypothetical protein